MRKALLIAAAWAAAPMAAHAGLLLEYSEGGNPFISICAAASGTSCNVAHLVTTNGLDFITVGATSNSPGTPTSADLLTATVQMTNPTSSAESITLLSGDIGFSKPLAPPPVEFLNSISGTVVSGGAANAFTSQACLSEADGQNVCPGDFITPLITAAIQNPGAGANSNFTILTSLTGPYSMTEELMITLAPGANINFTASSDVSPASVSEPSTLALLGSAIGGLLLILRRRSPKTWLPPFHA
jgi:hypothetical protein